MHGRFTPAAAAALILLALGGHAEAAASSETTATLSFQLTDFRPGDGIAPSLTMGYADFSSQTSATGIVYAGSPYYLQHTDQTTSAFGSISSTVSRSPDLTGTSSITGDLLAGAPITLSATAHSNTADSRFTSDTLLGGYALGSGAYLTLSPFTEITVSGTIDTVASSSAAAGTGELASSYSQIELWSTTGQSLGGIYQHVGAGDTYGLPTSTQSETQPFRLSFYNSGPTAQVFLLSAEVAAVAVLPGSATPVPEPAGAPLLLAGLGIVAGIAKRRRGR